MKKRILALTLVLCMTVLAFAGCSKELYKYDSYGDFIQLCNTVGIEIKQSDIDNGILDAYHSKISDEDKVETTYTDPDGDILVENGDTVNIDYEGKLDGVAFAGGTSQGSDLVIGSNTFIDGFEDGLIGYGVGDTLDLELTFPDPYTNNPDLAGKLTVFTVTINSIKRTAYPEYNDENVKANTDYETVEAFEEANRDTIIKNLLWNEFYAQSKVKTYPEKELRKYYNDSIKSVENNAAMFGYSIEAFVSYYYGYSDIKSFYTYLASSAKSQVKQELLVLAYIEKNESVQLSDEAYEKEIEDLYNEYVGENGYEGSLKKFKKEFDDISIKLAIYYDIVIEDIMKTMEVVDDVTKNGFVKDRNGVRFYDNNVYKTGWTELDPDGDGTNALYYFDTATGYAASGCVLLAPNGEVTEKYLEFGENGLYVGLYDGKYTDKTGTRYFENGALKTGWAEVDLDSAIEGNEKYYFDPASDGYMLTGIASVAGVYYNFGKTGICAGEVEDGLNADDGGTKYFEGGALVTGWKELDANEDSVNEKYYFDPANDGYMVVSAICDVEGTYYTFDSTGNCTGVTADGSYVNTTGTRYIDGGKLVTGWYETCLDDSGENSKYYFDPNNDGYMVKNTILKIGDKYETFDAEGKYLAPYDGLFVDKTGARYFENGDLCTGAKTIDNGEGKQIDCYFDPENDGYAYCGKWYKEGGENKYYYASDYSKAVSTVITIEGVTYTFDENGNFTTGAAE